MEVTSLHRHCLLVVWLLVVLPLGHSRAASPFAVTVTGQPPYDYAIARAFKLTLPSPPACVDADCRLRSVVLPSGEPRAGKSAWAVATLGVGSLPTFALPVRVTRLDVADVPASRLLVSNVPERVARPRALCEARVDATAVTRLLYHHLNDSDTALAFMVELINPSTVPVRVQIIDAGEGPALRENEAGHRAALQYAEREGRNAGVVITLAPATATAIIRTGFPPHTIVSGLARLRVLTPAGTLIVRVRAHLPNEGYATAPLSRYNPSSIYGDFQFATTCLTFRADFAVGGVPLSLPMGETPIPAERPGQDLDGGYGVWHRYTVALVNATSRKAVIEVAVNAAGGPGRLVYSFGGDWRETGTLLPGRVVRLTGVSLAAGERRTLTLTAMPQSGSNYPMRFTFRAQ